MITAITVIEASKQTFALPKSVFQRIVTARTKDSPGSINKIAEYYSDDDLQETYFFEIFSEDQDLQQYQQYIK